MLTYDKNVEMFADMLNALAQPVEKLSESTEIKLTERPAVKPVETVDIHVIQLVNGKQNEITVLNVPVSNHTASINSTLTIDGTDYYVRQTLFNTREQPIQVIAYPRYSPVYKHTLTTDITIFLPDGTISKLSDVAITLDYVRDMYIDSATMVDNKTNIQRIAETPEIKQLLQEYKQSRELDVTQVSILGDSGVLYVETKWRVKIPDTIISMLNTRIEPDIINKKLCSRYSQQFIKHINTTRKNMQLPLITCRRDSVINQPLVSASVVEHHNVTTIDNILQNYVCTRPCVIQSKHDITPEELADVMFSKLSMSNKGSLAKLLHDGQISDACHVAALPYIISAAASDNTQQGQVIYTCLTLLQIVVNHSK